MSTDDRAKLLAKIRALMSKTIENGCTEAEAMAALSMVRAMMDAYEVTEEDLQLKGEAAEIKVTYWRDPKGIRKLLGVKIAEFCNCKVWQGKKGEIKFCGLKSDLEFSDWLMDSLSSFVLVNLVSYMATQTYMNKHEKNRIVNGFVYGCCSRINQRIEELIEASKINCGVNANALVVAKDNLINLKMQEAGVKIGKSVAKRKNYYTDSFKHGRKVGDKASFGRPVTGQAGMLRIGSKLKRH